MRVPGCVLSNRGSPQGDEFPSLDDDEVGERFMVY
jgi:hypothetical protein